MSNRYMKTADMRTADMRITDKRTAYTGGKHAEKKTEEETEEYEPEKEDASLLYTFFHTSACDFKYRYLQGNIGKHDRKDPVFFKTELRADE